MAITLIVNPGSSSKKYALYDNGVPLLAAHVEHDEKGITLCLTVNDVADRCVPLSEAAYHTSLLDFIERALSERVISSATEIDVVGVRVVAPGTHFIDHRLVDDLYMAELKKAATRAPLHVPHTEKELAVVRQALPHAKVVGVSDSAFHRTMPEAAREYSLPPSVTRMHDLHRYGYHGISMSSVCEKVARQLGGMPERMIACHIGSGVSVTAIEHGRSLDTTMGFAPGSGLIMGSRAGDVDTGALLALMQERNLKPVDVELYLQTEGGLKGLSGESDLRTLLNRRVQGNTVATSTIDHYVYAIAKAIGAMTVALGGIDVLVFTATASERSPVLRKLIVDKIAPLGIMIDPNKNDFCVSRDAEITDTDSQARVLVVRNDEAAAMLRICSVIASE
jgi:acetate kinase